LAVLQIEALEGLLAVDLVQEEDLSRGARLEAREVGGRDRQGDNPRREAVRVHPHGLDLRGRGGGGLLVGVLLIGLVGVLLVGLVGLFSVLLVAVFLVAVLLVVLLVVVLLLRGRALLLVALLDERRGQVLAQDREPDRARDAVVRIV